MHIGAEANFFPRPQHLPHVAHPLDLSSAPGKIRLAQGCMVPHSDRVGEGLVKPNRVVRRRPGASSTYRNKLVVQRTAIIAQCRHSSASCSDRLGTSLLGITVSMNHLYRTEQERSCS